MTLLIGFLAISAVIGFWLYAIERGQRLTADHDYNLLQRDFLALEERHNIALDDLDAMVEAITLNAKAKHPAGRFSLIKGEGA